MASVGHETSTSRAGSEPAQPSVTAQRSPRAAGRPVSTKPTLGAPACAVPREPEGGLRNQKHWGGVLGARDPLGGRSPHGQQQRAGPGRHARATESGRSRREVAPASEQAKVRRESRQDSRRGRQAGNWTPKSPGKGVAAGGPRKLLAQGPRGTLILTAQNSGRWCEKNSEHRLVSGPCARAPW